MAAATLTQEEQMLAHSVHYAASKSPIKDDIAQLAACWKSGSGALTKQEAGLLLWYHSQKGEDGSAEVLGAGVLTSCLETLDSSTALSADKSTAAGLLVSLCSDDTKKEQIAKGKTSGANGSSCCQVLHACLANPATAPRHAVNLLATLASHPVSLTVLLKALAGEVPWRTYIGLLHHSHAVAKDHSTAVATAKFVQQLVTGRAILATDAAGAGMLEALLASAAAHKSAAAVGAAASCLLAMCLAAPDLREQLGKLPGAVQQVVDLLGPPPATIIPWEQQQLALQAAAAASNETEPTPKQQQPAGRAVHPTTSSMCMTSGNTGVGGSVGARSRSGAVQDALHTTEGEAAGKDAAEEQQGMARTRRKSLRILSIAEGEAAMAGSNSHAAVSSTGSDRDAISPSLRSKSLLGCMKQSSTCYASTSSSSSSSSSSKAPACPRNPVSPLLRSPPLSTNSTALKWEGPVPPATRAAAAGLLAQLVQLPHLREAACERLATPRLAVLLTSTMQQLAETGKKGKGGGKKSNKLVLTPEFEQLLTHICGCLEFLVAGDNADCYRVAAAGCLPALVQLASEARNTQLRRAAKAVVAQVMLLSEAQLYVQQAEVPEDLVALEEGTQVLLKLKDVEIKQLLIEVPAGSCLQALDEVTARARC